MVKTLCTKLLSIALKCRNFGPPQNGLSTASSMGYSFAQKLCFFTFVVCIARRKKVITAHQIIIFFEYLLGYINVERTT